MKLDVESWMNRSNSKIAALAISVVFLGCARTDRKNSAPLPQQATQPPVGLSAPPVAPPVTQDNLDTSCYRGEPVICQTERLITDQTNAIRRARGLSPLTHDAKLSFIARQWSQEQGDGWGISHAGFPRLRVQAFRQEFGQQVPPRMAAENVAMTSVRRDAQPSHIASDFTRMWETSSGHYQSMIGNFRMIGVGVYRNPRGGYYATQIFAW
jgi:uncharacterized protein YkwD